MMRSRCAALVAVALCGCATAPEKKERVWPAPPDPPRIRFVEWFRHTDQLDQSAWARFSRTIAGGSNEPALGQPMGLALAPDGKRLFIADLRRSAVFRADFEERRLELFAPEQPFPGAFGIALDPAGNVYVSCSGDGRVIVLDPTGKVLRGIGKGELERPTGIALDAARARLYVADGASRQSKNHRVRAFDLEGKHLFDLRPRETEAATGPGDGELFFPLYVAVGADGNVWVADTMNFRVQAFDPEGRFLRKLGQAGDGPGSFARVRGLAFDRHGNLYVVDAQHAVVQIFGPDLDPLMYFGGPGRFAEQFDVPSPITIDQRTDRIYVGNEYFGRVNVYELLDATAPARDETNPAPSPAAGERGSGAPGTGSSSR